MILEIEVCNPAEHKFLVLKLDPFQKVLPEVSHKIEYNIYKQLEWAIKANN